MFQYFPRAFRANKQGGLNTMSEILERRRIQTFHADGFGDFFLVNGVLRCTAFALVKSPFERREPDKVALFHLRAGLAGAAEAQLEVQRLLEQASGDGFRFMRSAAAH